MLKPAFLICLLAIACACLADLKSELASRYRAWDAAYLKQDAKKLASFLHPSFRIVTTSGKIIKRKDYVGGLGNGKRPEVYRTTVIRAELKGARAFAWTKEVSRKPGEKDHVHRYRDTWAKVRGKWLLLESKTLEEN